MARIDDSHDLTPSQQTPGGGAAGWIVSIGVAVIAGALIVFGWTMLRDRISAALPIPMGFGASSLAFGGSSDRIGRPTVAPILRGCIFDAMDMDPDIDVQPGFFYALLKAGTLQSKVRGLMRKADDRDALRSTEIWGKLATCVATSAPLRLCDADNRAVAVEAIDEFLSKADEALVLLKRNADDPSKTAEFVSRKSEIGTALRSHLRDGVIIAADFGFFPAAEISNILSEAKPIRDTCARPSK